MNTEIKEITIKAYEIRKLALKMIYNAQSGHPGGSLSSAEILASLYFKVLRLDPKNPNWEDRDRFILSKGHASAAYYAALALRGFFPLEELFEFRKINSRLQGHPTVHVPGVDMTTGSLGQGLSNAIGMAIAGKLDEKDYTVYVLIGDGEMDEGIVWEAVLNAPHRKLDNLIVILDRNKYQLDGATESILKLEPIEDKFRAFNWEVFTVNGHDVEQILRAIGMAKEKNGKPKIIVANTVKGKGVSFMENTHEFHGKAPNKDQFEKAISELETMERKIMEGNI
ncbi:MAG: transketolase [Thermoplasmata archaeon]